MKSFEVCGHRGEVFWDLLSAKYNVGPEPQQGYFVAIVCDGEMVLLLGDKTKEAYSQTRAKPAAVEATLLSRKEHVFGKKHFITKAQFGETGKAHDIVIECQTTAPRAPYLRISVDKQLLVQIKNLEWKFRGNQTVQVDGIPVEVFWDVHNWIFNSGSRRHSNANATFMFTTCSGTETSPKKKSNAINWSGDLNGNISVMKLAGTRSLNLAKDMANLSGSSLMLHAWRSE
ncbi:hypothetical protein KP509_01G059900 [Ceratopteris richardii]|nr:hypothetical protein KP509_01G059900 [Ceratopteris richardii]